jgi:hypothetical protein
MDTSKQSETHGFKAVFHKVVTVYDEVHVTRAQYYSHLFFSSGNVLDSHLSHLIPKSTKLVPKGTMLWPLRSFAIHAHYNK